MVLKCCLLKIWTQNFKHIHYVWDNYIKKAAAKELAIIAHSFGGVLACSLLHDKEMEIFGKSEVPHKLKAIAFTDSVHSANPRWSKKVKNFLGENAKNWKQSKWPLGRKMRNSGGCPNVSAGTTVHEETSSSCIEPLWEFIEEQLGLTES